MPILEIFVHDGCLSQQSAVQLAHEVRQALPSWHIEIRQADSERARALELVALPAFVLNGKVLLVGTPSIEWLLHTLQEQERRADERLEEPSA